VRTPPAPQFKDPPETRKMQDVIDFMGRQFDKRTPDNEVRRELFLRDPDGGIWSVGVDNTGAFTSTKVSDG
jgi:hypothetical protein